MEERSLGMTIGSIVAGVMCGLLPLIVGCTKRRYYLAVLVFAACVAGGYIMGLIIALPVGIFGALALSNLENGRRRY